MSRGKRKEVKQGGSIVDLAAALPETEKTEAKKGTEVTEYTEVVKDTEVLGAEIREIVAERTELEARSGRTGSRSAEPGDHGGRTWAGSVEPETGIADPEAPENEAPEFDYHDEMIQIEMLFQSHILSFGYKEYTLENYADRRYFADWKAREGCLDTDEMRAGLNIDGILRSASPSESEVLTYLQYVLNIAELCRRSFNREEAQGYDFDIRNYTQLLTRVRDILRRLHYDYRYVESKEFIFIVPRDAMADAAIPDIPSDPLYGALTEYRSTSSAGDLLRKRSILAGLGKTIESYPDNLKNGNELLYSRLEFLLNNVNIRNDNRAGGEKIDRIAAMTDGELEEWYDETYRMLLLRILSHENLERMQRIDHLANECGTAIESVTAEEIAQIMDGFPTDEESRGQAQTDSENAALVSSRTALYEEELETALRENSRNSHAATKAIIAVFLADVLFMLFLMYYFKLI